MSASTLSVKVQLENLDKASADLTKFGQAATTAGDQLVAAGQKGSKFGQDIASGIQPLQTGFSSAQTAIQKFSQETLQTQQSTFRLTGALSDVSQALPGMNSGLGQSGTAMNELVSNTGRFEEGLSSAASETSTFTGALSGIGDSMGQLAGDANELGTSLSGISADTSGIDNLVSSTSEATGIFASAGTEAENFGNSVSILNDGITPLAGGLDEASTLTDNLATGMGTAATATEGLGTSTQSAIGAFTALGGTLGTGISLLFRMSDAQLSLDKANLKVARTTETARKARLAFSNLLTKDVSNIPNITAAHEGLNTAVSELTELEKTGITSGEQYAAAQDAVAKATATLKEAFVEGGGSANDFDAALAKVTNTQAAADIATQNADKSQRNWLTTMLETPFAIAGFAGSVVTATADSTKMKDTLGKVATGIKGKLIPALTGGATGMAGLGAAIAATAGIAAIALAAFQAYPVVMSAIESALASFAGEAEKAAIKAKESFEAAKSSSVGGWVDVLGWIFKTNEALDENIKTGKESDEQKKKSAQASKEVTTVLDTEANAMRAALDATNGNTTAMAALQRTHSDLQLNIDRSGTSLDDFQTIMFETNKAMTEGATKTDSLTKSMYDVYAAMTQTTDQALTLSNLFPELGANIENALLGQKQGLDVGIQLWNDFNSRVQTGQYEVGEFNKYIQDMGYTLGPAIQSGVDKISEITAKIEEARATIPGYIEEVTTAIKGETDAIGAEAKALADSNTELAEAQAIRNDVSASADKLHTALNNTLISLYDEEAALQASIAATESLEIQKQRLGNATLEGEKSAREWIAALDESKAAEEAEISILQDYASQFGEFPGVIEPTVDSLHDFIEANEQGGQAAIDFQQKVLDAYNGLVSEAQPLFDSLTAAIHLSGKEQTEGIQKAWDDLLPGVADTLTLFDRMAIDKFTNMQAEIERGQQSFQTKLAAGWMQGMDMDDALAGARTGLMGFLEEAKRESGSAWGVVWDEAETIAQTGSVRMIDKMLEAIRSGKAPEEVEKMLQAIIDKGEPAGRKLGEGFSRAFADAVSSATTQVEKDMANRFGEILKGSQQEAPGTPSKYLAPTAKQLAPKAAAAPTATVDISAGTTQLQILQSQINGLKQMTIPTITVNIQPAAAQLQSLVATLSSIRQAAPIPINADVNPAATALQSLVATISTIAQTAPISILVDTQPATIMITGVTTAINAITQSTIPTITVDKAQADAVINSAQLSINGLKQTKIPTLTADKSPLDKMVNSAQLSINGLKQTKIPKLTADISDVINKVNQAQSKINSLKGKNVTNTVTTRYVTQGSPAVGGRQHGGSFITNTSTKLGGVSIGEYNKPELVTVTPLTNPNDASDRNINKTINVPSAKAVVPNSRLNGAGGSSGGGQPIEFYHTTHIHGNDIISDKKLTEKINMTAGKRKGQMFR